MELQGRKKDMLVLYAFVNSMLSKAERIEVREAINEDLNNLLDENKISIEEYNTMHEELDEIDELQDKEV